MRQKMPCFVSVLTSQTVSSNDPKKQSYKLLHRVKHKKHNFNCQFLEIAKYFNEP